MFIIWGASWCLLVIIVMYVTLKYYLPILSKRTLCKDSEPSLISKEDNSEFATKSNTDMRLLHLGVLDSRAGLSVMLWICAIFAFFCGYSAAMHSESVIGMFKMTLGICVLSCAFITDMKLMIIPNLCPLTLVIGRLGMVIMEFIWVKDEAKSWLLNSIIAMLISLVLLLLMVKLTRGGLGMGDVKLFSSIGFLCGIRAVCFSLMFTLLFCALVSTGLLLCKKKKLKDALPLGPFIWLGYAMTVLLSII